jgi:membrane protein implicated in regulation of membrane protease activity
MAAIFILAGGLFGFASAIVSLILLDASFALALGIWSGAGLLVVVLGLGTTMVARRLVRDQTKHASSRAHTI